MSRGRGFGGRTEPPRGASRPPARPATPPPELMHAVSLHQQNRLLEADAIYARLLEQHPRMAEALALRGYLAHQRGDDRASLALLDQALAINPQIVDAHLWRGMALQRLQRFAEAAESYRKVLRLNPQHVDAHNNLGTVMVAEGNYAEAAKLHEAAIRLRPERAHSYYCLGAVRQRQGSQEAAVDQFRRALKLAPNHVDARNNLGVALIDLRRNDEAAIELRRAVELEPQRSETYTNLARALQNLGRFGDAEAVYRNVLELYPDYAEARAGLANLLQDFGRNDEALEELRFVRETRPDYLPAASSLLMKLIYEPANAPAMIAREHRSVGRAFMAAAGRSDPAWRVRDRAPERLLRVGYLSPDFNAHSCIFFLEPLLGAHDAATVEVHCYSNTQRPDAVTDRIRANAPHWHDITALSDRDAAALVAKHRIDILVDCAGHTSHNRLGLMALKPAPLQGTWLGYPHGTGLPTVDFRLTDAVADPPGDAVAESLERLIRLPQGFLSYRPLEDAPDPVPGPLERGVSPVIGCFNNAHKVGPDVAALWATILEKLPGAKLRLRANQFRDVTVAERYVARFEKAGLAAERMAVSGWAPSIQQGLADYANIDLALDPFPYNGTTTTCEALWMGVPVVTLAGAAHAGRVGASLLTRVGLAELIARDEQDYREIAVALVRDPARLAGYRRSLRARMAASPLCDAPGFARSVEAAYRDLWRDWCATGAEPPASLRSETTTPEAEPVEAPAANPTLVAPAARAPKPLPADKPQIRVLHNMARSGGTLIAQCLGALPGVALLSEIHPDGVRFIDPLSQAHEWYGLLRPEEVAELSMGREGRFLATIQLIESRARGRGLALLLRDWSHLDVIGVPQLAAPTGRQRLDEALAAGFGIRETCTVRHPIDQWQSMRRLNLLRGRVPLEAYVAAYRRFAEMAAEQGFLKYEDFTAAPDWAVRILAERLDLQYDPVFLQRWAQNLHVTGDLPADQENRRTLIVPSKRRPLEPGLLARFERHPDYFPALELLGYGHPI